MINKESREHVPRAVSRCIVCHKERATHELRDTASAPFDTGLWFPTRRVLHARLWLGPARTGGRWCDPEHVAYESCKSGACGDSVLWDVTKWCTSISKSATVLILPHWPPQVSAITPRPYLCGSHCPHLYFNHPF